MTVLHQLNGVGVTVWDSNTGKKIDLGSVGGRISAAVRAEIAEEERELTRRRVRAAHRYKSERGLVAGGVVFGYSNVRLEKGKTIRRRNPVEEAVVREIYVRYAAGEGAYSIAEALNSAKAASPSEHYKDRLNKGWSVSTVRDVLRRPLYRGQLVWGKTETVDGRELKRRGLAGQMRSGRTRESTQVPTDESQWVVLPADDDLRIIEPGRPCGRPTARPAQSVSGLPRRQGWACPGEGSWKIPLDRRHAALSLRCTL